MGSKGARGPRLLAVLTVGTAVILFAATLATARHAPGPPGGNSGPTSSSGHTPVTLCHATGSRTNPYVRITVDDDGVLGSGGSGGNGHDGHARDIIPPFAYTDNKGNPQTYPGKNWDSKGRAIFENGCKEPASSPPPPPGPPSPTPPPSNPPTSSPPPTSPPSSQPPVIDVVVTKVDAPDPVQVNTRLSYTITVTNKGPDPATHVQLSDPLPGKVVVLSVTSSQGTCSAPPLLACALGTIQPGQLVTVVVLVRPTMTGKLENTATAVGAEAEANPADNSATAVTVVYGVTKPPKKPKPSKQGVCVAFRVTPFSIRAGRVTTVQVVVRVGAKPGRHVRVVLRGAGASVVGVTGKNGVALVRVRPTRSGFVTVTLPGRRTCGGPRKVGVVTPVLEPPVTG